MFVILRSNANFSATRFFPIDRHVAKEVPDDVMSAKRYDRRSLYFTTGWIAIFVSSLTFSSGSECEKRYAKKCKSLSGFRYMYFATRIHTGKIEPIFFSHRCFIFLADKYERKEAIPNSSIWNNLILFLRIDHIESSKFTFHYLKHMARVSKRLKHYSKLNIC